MTITKPAARRVYECAKECAPIIPPLEVEVAAEVADLAFEHLLLSAKERGLKVPGDDRAENVVNAIFAFLVEANGETIEGLDAKIERATAGELTS